MILLSMENIADFIKAEIERKGWSQARLAKAAKLDSAVISNIINEKRGIGWESARAIADALNIPAETMFRKAGLLPPAPAKTEQHEKLLYMFEHLNAKDRQTILDMMEFFLDK
jgi:transcriptional regulator with XRE-family HTH domain